MEFSERTTAIAFAFIGIHDSLAIAGNKIEFPRKDKQIHDRSDFMIVEMRAHDLTPGAMPEQKNAR